MFLPLIGKWEVGKFLPLTGKIHLSFFLCDENAIVQATNEKTMGNARAPFMHMKPPVPLHIHLGGP